MKNRCKYLDCATVGRLTTNLRVLFFRFYAYQHTNLKHSNMLSLYHIVAIAFLRTIIYYYKCTLRLQTLASTDSLRGKLDG